MNNTRTEAYALLRILFNGNEPCAFSNFFADLCDRYGTTSSELAEISDKCFDELAKREAEKVGRRLRRRFAAECQRSEEHNI